MVSKILNLETITRPPQRAERSYDYIHVKRSLGEKLCYDGIVLVLIIIGKIAAWSLPL